MVDRRKLELQRQTAVAKECVKAGIPHEGILKIAQNGVTRWFNVWIEFYPKVHWMIEEVEDLLTPDKKIAGTRRKLDDETKAKLESWL